MISAVTNPAREPSPEELPTPDRPRSVKTVQGLLLTLVPLVLGVLALAGLAGQCAFNPGAADPRGGPVRTVDAGAQLPALARSAPFPVRVPQLPPSWRANSTGLDRLGRDVVVRAGWITPAGDYLRLSQSSAARNELLAAGTGARPEPAGTVRVRGRDWAVHAAADGERVWLADLGEVRLLITGSAGEPEFRTLAAATLRS